MAILEKLYSTVKSCKEDNRVEGAATLDIAAGYFVGSMEGKDEGGSFDGGLIFMLAKRMCGEHCLTCTTTNCLLGLTRSSLSSPLFFRSSLWYSTQSYNGRINERILSFFYTMQGEVETGVSLHYNNNALSLIFC